MGKDRLGIGIIGSGFNARFHLRAFVGVRDADIRGIWSPNATNAAEAANLAQVLEVGEPKLYRSISDMPQFSDLSDKQIAAIVTWIHYARRKGRFQELTAASVQSGDAAAGKTYFDRACSSCHAIDRDLAGIGNKYDAAALRAAVLDPKGLKVELSFTVDRIKDTKITTAQQRHHALLENYSVDDVTNLVAYLASSR